MIILANALLKLAQYWPALSLEFSLLLCLGASRRVVVALNCQPCSTFQPSCFFSCDIALHLIVA